MNDRIDRYLDGELERVALGPDERAAVEMLESAIEETRAFVDARRAPDLTAAVMGRIQQVGSPLARHRRRRLSALRATLSTLWRVRDVSFRFRPVYAVVAAASITILTVILPINLITSAPPRATDDDIRTFPVQFRLQAQEASSVRLAGSFTNWQPEHELHQSAPGIWTITLSLPLGVHDYSFVIDGSEWVPDPYAPAIDDGFGGVNSRIALLPPDQPRT